MKLYIANIGHIIVCAAIIRLCFLMIFNTLSFQSNFPFDIYDEISGISFSKFNHQSGSYQRIIPSVAHYFSFGKEDCELTYSEASSVLSSFKIGGFDTIYIHALDTGICGKFAEYLIDHLKDKLVINDVFSNATQLEGLTTWQDKLIVSQLYFLSEIGGVMLPFDRLCVGSLEHLWHQESFIALDESENIISMGGHQGARLWQQAITEYLEISLEQRIGADIFINSFKKASDISTLVYNVEELVRFEGQHHPVQQHILRRLWKDI